MTNDLERRVWQHRTKAVEGFTSRYNIDHLSWYESTGEVLAAIERETEIKAWCREKQIRLIEDDNPRWADLAKDWFEWRKHQSRGRAYRPDSELCCSGA